MRFPPCLKSLHKATLPALPSRLSKGLNSGFKAEGDTEREERDGGRGGEGGEGKRARLKLHTWLQDGFQEVLLLRV